LFQACEAQAKAFKDKVDVGSVVITKLGKPADISGINRDLCLVISLLVLVKANRWIKSTSRTVNIYIFIEETCNCIFFFLLTYKILGARG
jgi:hypothetical protein